jgi:hypothetical protein
LAGFRPVTKVTCDHTKQPEANAATTICATRVAGRVWQAPKPRLDATRPGGQAVAIGLPQLWDRLVEVTRKPAPT